MMVSETHKRCPRCGEEKEATSEYWYFNASGRPLSYCISCAKENRRDQRLKAKHAQKEVPLEKECPKCGHTKKADEFPRNSTEIDGLHTWCRNCHSTYYSAYYRGERKDAGDRKRKRYRIDRASTKGYVYLFKMHDFYKIGISVNPEKRLRSMNAQCPYDAEIVAYGKFDDMYVVERDLHDTFAGKRLSGKEWFLLTDEDVEYVKRAICERLLDACTPHG